MNKDELVYIYLVSVLGEDFTFDKDNAGYIDVCIGFIPKSRKSEPFHLKYGKGRPDNLSELKAEGRTIFSSKIKEGLCSIQAFR